MKNKTLANILETSERTIFNKKKQNSKIIFLLEKYFSENEILEFLETEKIEKFELVKNIEIDKIEMFFNLQNDNKSIFNIIKKLNQAQSRALRLALRTAIAKEINISKSISNLAKNRTLLDTFKSLLFDKNDDFLLKEHFEKLENDFKFFNKEQIDFIDKNKDKMINFLNDIIPKYRLRKKL